MPKPLVIVESKTKADTIGRFLGPDYTVLASYGHVRDLPSKGLGVKVDDHFELEYAPPHGRAKEVVATLRRALKSADELYLATDEDREGEAIAWHLLELLKPKADVPVKRMVFHEITQDAIDDAIADPRGIDMKLVEAQEGRRALDRLVGYQVSPVLWRRVGGARSAGRVQSVAVRLVVERERERMAFRTAEFWDLEGRFSARDAAFVAKLVELDGRRVADGSDFDAATGLLATASAAVHLRGEEAGALASRLRDTSFTVASVESKEFVERPRPPFKTTTLQQEAGNKLRFSAGRTMHTAQGLYERGYITYMRTDSITLSGQAVDAARAQIVERFGQAFLPPAPRGYANKTKNAQEAHEAIRPAGARFRTPEHVRGELNRDEQALYELIWMRTIASQMVDARGHRVTLRLAGTSSAAEEAVFRAGGKSYDFLGFRMAYVDVSDEPADDDEAVLPNVGKGEGVHCLGLDAAQHATRPPARYTEATLVKVLEDSGIGRPSTYASIIETITSGRGYVWKKGNALVPSWTAFAKTQLLERYFAHLVDYGFTATMEEALDAVARGEGESEKWLHAFYFGDGSVGLRELVSEEHLAEIDMSEVNAIGIGADEQGVPVLVRVWNTGESIHHGDDKCPMPADLAPDELTVEAALELLAKGAGGPRELGIDPETGKKVLALTGRFGPFVQLGELEEGSKAKPPRASLFASMDPEMIELDTALRLLSLPRVVGADGEGNEITAQNGRYGPYLKKGTDSRSLETEDQIFTVTLAEAEAIFAQPKLRRGQRTKPPIAEFGPSPDTGAPIRVLDGRFGPYVTDGTTNATVRRGLDPASLTLEDALDLLRERAARGPTKKSARKTAKKTTKKATKKATKKRVKKATKKSTKQTVKNAITAARKTEVPDPNAAGASATVEGKPEPGT
ncbi:MAG: type I DNA topoisomerase [Actinobacteria bacterium]|nr:type I DNA topoisomerase [Actinomycetota bacterium]